MKTCGRLRAGRAVCTGLPRSAVSRVVLCGVEVSSGEEQTLGAWSRWGWREEQTAGSQRGVIIPGDLFQKGHPQMALVQLLKPLPQVLFLLQWSTFLAQFFQEVELYRHTICLQVPLRELLCLLSACGRSVQVCKASCSSACREDV